VILISRMKDESIVLGDDIILTVIEIRGDKVRLGVEHPKGVTVHRREVYEAICRAEQREPIVTPSSEG
jgi:carbon storage regulator